MRLQRSCEPCNGCRDRAGLSAGAEDCRLRGGRDEERERLIAVDRDRVVRDLPGSRPGEHDRLCGTAAEQPAWPKPEDVPTAGLPEGHDLPEHPLLPGR